MRHWDWPADATVEATQGVANGMRAQMAAGEAHYWTARNANGGFVGLFDLDLSGDGADLGFMLARACWGTGLAFEGASAVIARTWALGIRRLTARIHVGNDRSARLLARLGFGETHRGLVEIRPGVMRDCVFFTLDRP